MMTRLGRSCRRPISKSSGSCAGVTLTAPVPNSGSTCGSATTGIRRPVSGSSISRPTRCAYRGSSGCTATPVSPSIVSTRVVATTTCVVAVAVPDRDELPLVVGVLDLDVGQRRQAARAPVDDPLRPVDQPVLVKPLEHGLDRAGQPGVHREPLPAPVHAVAQPAHLAEYAPAGFGLPLPYPLDERLPAKIVPGQPFLGELALDHVLGGDARVVHAGQPERVVALHPAPPDQRVDQRVIERMTDMQRPGNVRRRDDDGERRCRRFGVGPEVASFYPRLVPAGLNLAWVVLCG